MVHCTISQCGISKLSFLVAGYALNRHNYIRFLHTAVIPFIRQLHSNERYWTWQLPTMPITYWLSSGNKAFALSPRMQINHALLRFSGSKISGPCSKRLFMMEDGRQLQSRRWSRASRKRLVKFPFQRSFISSTWWQFALKMAIGRSTVRYLTHAPLGTNLPCNIDESTYFCLGINECILIP